MTPFHRAVYRLVSQIPPGRVATYGQIAALLGHPRAARAVGMAMKRVPPGVPWQRVVNARGGISLRANVAGMLTQRLLLEREGV
ncbi:MAG TPA: MGMT family protein, partial [Methylomirabilota bacterium]|nr:MGMT family protein [Methylomirabilota bacterium]